MGIYVKQKIVFLRYDGMLHHIGRNFRDMFEESLGMLLTKERVRRKISLARLANGIVSSQWLDKIEKGYSETDLLTIDVLFQRLGRNPESLECILSDIEYKKLYRRDLIERAIACGKYEEAKSLLDDYYKNLASKDRLSTMYYHRTKAAIADKMNDHSMAVDEIKEAINQTIPRYAGAIDKKRLLSIYEIENLLLYAKLLAEENHNELSKKIANECIEAIERSFKDTEATAIIKAKCTWVLCKSRAKDNLTAYMALVSCLENLRKKSVLVFAIPLLKEVIDRSKVLGIASDTEKYTDFYIVIKDLYKEYDPNRGEDDLFTKLHIREIHLDYEVVKYERKKQGITQESLIEGIYSEPLSLQNFESGRSTPNKKGYVKIMEKLGLPRERYNNMLAVDSFDTLELVEKLGEYCEKHEIDSAKHVVDELEQSMNMDYERNKSFVQTFRKMLIYYNSGSEDESLIRELTHEVFDEIGIRKIKRVLFRSEITKINLLCGLLYRKGEYDKEIDIIDKVISNFKNSATSVLYHNKTYVLLLGSKYEVKALKGVYDNELFNKVVTLGLCCNTSNLLPYLLYIKGINTKNAATKMSCISAAATLGRYNFNNYILDAITADETMRK